MSINLGIYSFLLKTPVSNGGVCLINLIDEWSCLKPHSSIFIVPLFALR